MSEEIIAQIAQAEDHTRLEVALIQDDYAEPRIELRTLSWGTGLGWYRCNTLTLDGGTAHQLMQALRQVRRRTHRASSPASGRKVLPFPAPSAAPTALERQVMQR